MGSLEYVVGFLHRLFNRMTNLSNAGTVFDVTNIVPYLMKYKKHPVTGEPLALKVGAKPGGYGIGHSPGLQRRLHGSCARRLLAWLAMF